MVTREDMVDGEVYWTYVGSLEDMNYNEFGDPGIARTRQVKLDLYAGRAHSFNKETGEMDFDANATVLVDPEVLYKTEEECNKDRAVACQVHVAHTLDKLAAWLPKDDARAKKMMELSTELLTEVSKCLYQEEPEKTEAISPS